MMKKRLSQDSKEKPQSSQQRRQLVLREEEYARNSNFGMMLYRQNERRKHDKLMQAKGSPLKYADLKIDDQNSPTNQKMKMNVIDNKNMIAQDRMKNIQHDDLTFDLGHTSNDPQSITNDLVSQKRKMGLITCRSMSSKNMSRSSQTLSAGSVALKQRTKDNLPQNTVPVDQFTNQITKTMYLNRKKSFKLPQQLQEKVKKDQKQLSPFLDRTNKLHKCVDTLALEQEKISKGLENKYYKRLSATYEIKKVANHRGYLLQNLVAPH